MRKETKAFFSSILKKQRCILKVMLYADRFYTSLQDSTRISKCSKDIINRELQLVCLCANTRTRTIFCKLLIHLFDGIYWMPMWQAVWGAVTKITFWTSKTQKVPTNLIIAFYIFKQKFTVLRHITPTLLLAPLLLLLPLSLSLALHSASGLHTILKAPTWEKSLKLSQKMPKDRLGSATGM